MRHLDFGKAAWTEHSTHFRKRNLRIHFTKMLNHGIGKRALKCIRLERQISCVTADKSQVGYHSRKSSLRRQQSPERRINSNDPPAFLRRRHGPAAPIRT